MKTDCLAINADVTTFTVTEPLTINDEKTYSIGVSFSSGTINGDLSLECLVHPNIGWVRVVDSDQAIVAGASHVWNVHSAGYPKVRVSWAYTSGAGTLEIQSVLKTTPIIGV